MMVRPRLRVLTASWPGRKEPWRAQFIRDLHLELADEFDTEVIAPRIHEEDPLEEDDGPLRVRRFRYRSGSKAPRAGGGGPIAALSWLLSAYRESRKWQRDQIPSLVLAHWAVPTAIIARRCARRLGCPFIVWCHGSDVHHYGRTGIGARLLRTGVESADRVLAASKPMASELMDRHHVSAVELLPIGIDSIFLDRPVRVSPTMPLKLLWVGERIESKGYHRVLDAVEGARQEGVSVALEVIGGGAGNPRERHQDHQIRGPQSPVEVVAAMDRSHLLLLPSKGEGTPLVIQEAIARGLPVAATPVGGIPELFPGGAGWFPIAGKNEQEICTRLRDVIVEVAAKPEMLESASSALMERDISSLSRQCCADRLRTIVSEVLS